MSLAAKRSYDVIVVGAGPAGATLGYELARKGVDVLILEKERLPRYKACAGGVTVKTARLLDFDVGDVAQRVVTGVRVSYKGSREFARHYGQPLVYMVMRDEFDQCLVQRAKEAGADLIDNQRVSSVVAGTAGVEVMTADDTFAAQVVAGADGANSIVASSIGLAEGRELGVAMQAEVSVPGEMLIKWDSLLGLDLGHMRGGYGWVFPKKDHLSVGVGGPLCQAKKLKAAYQRVLDAQGLERYASDRPRSHFLPVLKNRAAIQHGRALLLGDAAGLVDPLTGEGIYYAIKSGQMAAPVIVERLQSNAIDLKAYQGAVARGILPELRAARALMRLFTWSAESYFSAVEGYDRLWNASCRLLRGETSYLSLKKRLGKFQFVFDLLSR
jgi:geranylgeranyl reductase family protein